MGVYYTAEPKGCETQIHTYRVKEHANNTVSDEAFAKRHERWPTDTPDTKEAYYIREVFNSTSPSGFGLLRPYSFCGSPPDLFPTETAAQTAVRYGISCCYNCFAGFSCSNLS